jgi:hypothetical protein
MNIGDVHYMRRWYDIRCTGRAPHRERTCQEPPDTECATNTATRV